MFIKNYKASKIDNISYNAFFTAVCNYTNILMQVTQKNTDKTHKLKYIQKASFLTKCKAQE